MESKRVAQSGRRFGIFTSAGISQWETGGTAMPKKTRKPGSAKTEESPLREISKDELAEILAQHRKWVESEEKEGKRADLPRALLINANLQGAYLIGANLQRALLASANLQRPP